MFELLLFKEQEKHLALVSITYHITLRCIQLSVCYHSKLEQALPCGCHGFILSKFMKFI